MEANLIPGYRDEIRNLAEQPKHTEMSRNKIQLQFRQAGLFKVSNKRG
jgi:hypothetical protein